jgi:hypothetical protein
MKTKLTFVVS